MSLLRAGWLAWGMWVVGVAAIALSAWLASLNAPISTTQTPESLLEGALWLSTWVGFGLVGALIVGRRADNRIGWLLTGITFSLGWAVFAPAYARFAMVTAPQRWPLGEAAAWFATWNFFPALALVVALVVLFPTGTPTHLGRRVMKVFLSVAIVNAVVYALRPGPIEGDTPPLNPLGVPGLRPVLDQATEWLGVTLAVVALVALVDAVRRFRRSSGAERLQFRWFMLAIVAFPVMFVSAVFASDSIIGPDEFDPVVVAFTLWGNGTALAIWFAISRHHLYEIDRIVSRTVSYALVTVTLIAFYGLCVFLLGNFLPVEGDLPVAVSTLAVAALFNPLRRRVQATVDRKFDRTRVDGEQMVEWFSHRLRGQADLPQLKEVLAEAVTTAMAPETLSLWLRRR